MIAALRLVLAEGRQVTIHRDEHFRTTNTAMSCMDAPIWGPDGRLLAALDVSSARADQTERYNRLIAAQVAQTAKAIEAVFFRASFPNAASTVILRLRPQPPAPRSIFNPDIAELHGAAFRLAALRVDGLERAQSWPPRLVRCGAV